MEERNMECDCAPVKKRKLSENQVSQSESNKKPNLVAQNENGISTCTRVETSNAVDVINQDDECNNVVKDGRMEGSQVDCFDLELESNESKNTIGSEGSVLTTDELSNNTESQINSLTKLDLDANKESASQVTIEDNSRSHSKKKLLVLDVNGLLVDIVLNPDPAYKADSMLGAKAVFKRPYCDEFLKFCFERFNVGVWTSRTRRNIERVLDFLMKDTQRQLLFCWDQSHCTETGFNTIENTGKPLVLKELKKLWEKHDPNLPWDKGVYNESNTLLLDDSPYKALRNPPHTAIFPHTYQYRDTQDNDLGPNGNLRNYLERLAASDDVQKYIEQNPFGQLPISYNDKSWKFYLKVIGATEPEVGPSRSRKKLLVIDVSGLVVDVTVPREGYKADTIQGSRAVYKRPYCDEFLRFLFERFNVGIWTSMARRNMEWIVDFVLKDYQDKLLFCWDRADCTDTGFRTVENIDKTLFLKELRMLWEKKDPDLPWKIGDYDKSNTLLIEHAPHKALLNPPHTAIFPYPYRYSMTEDNFLGPKGELRVYLERLASAEDVQKFVQENPFGQRPIREKNLSWGFYQKVIRAFSYKQVSNANGSHLKNSSVPKPGTTTDLVIPSLVESNTDSSTDAVIPTVLKPETDTNTISTTQPLPEPETKTTIDLVGQTSLEPETDITTSVVGPTLFEPNSETVTVSAAPTSLEPEIDITNLVVAPTLLESKSDTSTALAAPTLREPNTETNSTTFAASTLLDPATETTAAASATITFNTTSDVADQTLSI
ncbi:uncharacterized protein [Rutidosis leptorrhynchoides]|uniref:uncharacterized protein n=1 Tax=Rutidosis leptorrhynchoides TaxID=125765 RepID=UPI003A99B3E2